MKEQAQKTSSTERASPARELGVWLRAVQSFFDQGNYPFGEAERAEATSRNLKCETRIVQDVLFRCLQLTGSLSSGEPPADVYEEAAAVDDLTPTSAGRERSDNLAGGSIPLLEEALRDATRLCDALLESPSVSFVGWAALGGVITRELKRPAVTQMLFAASAQPDGGILEGPLARVADGLAPDELGEDLRAIFSSFALLLERLSFVEVALKRDGVLKPLLPIFALVLEETRELLDFIEHRALRVEGAGRGEREILDGTAYAVKMEIRKAFDHELVGFCATRQPPLLFAKIENAHGLLRDCYQQSVVALAQHFDPSLEGEKLFAFFQTKLDQSLTLRRDLWRLIKHVRRAEGEGEAFPVASLLERLNDFREGSLRFLMYKDWETFERFVEEVEMAQKSSDLAMVLHRFDAFLETLFGQVNMRAVLAAHPFDPDSAGDTA